MKKQQPEIDFMVSKIKAATEAGSNTITIPVSMARAIVDKIEGLEGTLYDITLREFEDNH